MSSLASGKWVACRAGSPTVTDSELAELLPQWQVKKVEGMKRLESVFKCKNFVHALAFINKVGAVAEEENHYPLVITDWGRVTFNWWSPNIRGLHKNDFIMAAKTDELYQH
jgi:4a-hydroxytetrahydrobiopterin dehydratase